MTLATEVKKLTDSKPFYVVAGVGDYAVEKLRELPEQLLKLQSRRSELAKDLPVKAREYADVITHRAAEAYEDFASRGRKVVSKTTGEAALELEELSEAAEPPVATPVKKTRTTKAKA